MSEPPSSRPLSRSAAPQSGRSADKPPDAATDKRGLFERLVQFLSPGPDSTDELMATLPTPSSVS